MSLVARPFRGLFIGLFGTFALFGTSMTIVGAALRFVPVGGVYEPSPNTRVQGQTREGGAFTAMRLLPGSYRVYVVEDAQDVRQYMADPGFLRSQEKAFPPLQVVAGDNPPLNLAMPSK